MTTSGPRGEQGGEHGGAMDKLKSVWREAVGSRDEDEARAEGTTDRADARADSWGERPAPSGTAHPADVRPDISARNASGMNPADSTGPVAQQSPQYEVPQRAPQQAGPGPVPRQQQAPAAQNAPAQNAPAQNAGCPIVKVI